MATNAKAFQYEIGLDRAGRVTAAVTKREGDGRYAFVELDVELNVELEPEPEDLQDLLAKAERDCFVGASLTQSPRYRWRVNGSDIR